MVWNRSRVVLVGASVLLAASTVLSPSVAGAAVSSESGVVASFGGRSIDLSAGWGAARACVSDGVTTQCFRSEAEMDAALETTTATMVAASSTCSSSLRLYRSTSFGGSVLFLTAQGVMFNLSTYGFDNDTSSYRVGACDASFYDGANGGTPIYTGPTSAGSSASFMLSGWDNRVSSVYLP